jgi:hypothetical protein
MEIIVIGTDPPCPRCRETYERVKGAAMGITPQPKVRKIVYSSEEAQKLGRVGSGHEIAEWAGITVDWDEVRRVAVGEWTPELDHLLMPLKEVAVKVGWIMTPVVVMDGKVVHFGNVPTREQIRSWLGQLMEEK